MKSHYLILIVVVALLVVPTSAKYTFTGSVQPWTRVIDVGSVVDSTMDVSTKGDGIQEIKLVIGTGTTVSFTLWLGNGTQVSGTMVYEPSTTGCDTTDYCQKTEMTIGSSVYTRYYKGIEQFGRIDIAGYARDESTTPPTYGILVYDSTTSLEPSDGAFYPTDKMIYKYHLTANKPVGLFVSTAPMGDLTTAAKKSNGDVVNELWTIFNQIKDLVIEVFWFGFNLAVFLWENIWLIIAMYFALTGVMALTASKGKGRIFKAIKTWLKYQKSLLDFILGLWDTVIGLITKIIH